MQASAQKWPPWIPNAVMMGAEIQAMNDAINNGFLIHSKMIKFIISRKGCCIRHPVYTIKLQQDSLPET